METETPQPIAVHPPEGAKSYPEILSPEALSFICDLHQRFNERRESLLQARQARAERIAKGERPDFLPETKHIRQGDWAVAPIPKDLQDRRVEITGPVERKMIINALNSGAKAFMADFEDSSSPTFQNMLEGQINLRDAINGDISFTNPANGKSYQLNEQTATLLVRPRGWHLFDKHILVDGKPISGSIMDFGLYFFHNAKNLLAKGSGPYFYLPKLESHLEARLWNDIFVYAQDKIGIPQGSIKATVLIETILATFEVHEILYELREHSAGLNCGRWDYIFSYIKKFYKKTGFVLPERGQITMEQHFMRQYSRLVIQACHQHKVHAIGGMAAQIPIKADEEANRQALEKVRKDKVREARDGHDGTWVAHPGLIPIAMEAFDAEIKGPNQIDHTPYTDTITADDLLAIPTGNITEAGMVNNIDVSIQYLEAWLGGNGCVPIYNLMEDAATAEISRTQLWQWLHSEDAQLADGRQIDEACYEELKGKAIAQIKQLVGEKAFAEGHYAKAIELLDDMVCRPSLADFLTLEAYSYC